MKLPLLCVKKQPKLEPTTHCHPGPWIASNSYSQSQLQLVSRAAWGGWRWDGTRATTRECCYLLDVSRDAPAVEDVEAVEGPGRRRHRLRLHLRRHVGVLHHRLSFQHGTVQCPCSALAVSPPVLLERDLNSEDDDDDSEMCAYLCIPPSLLYSRSREPGEDGLADNTAVIHPHASASS